MFFHLFKTLISVNNVLSFQRVHRPTHAHFFLLLNLCPNIYSFRGYCKLTCFFNFTFGSFLVCRNAIDFVYWSYILQFCWICFFSSNKLFLVGSLVFSLYKIVSSANGHSFTCSFLIWIPLFFFFFFCLISLARISSIMLNRSGNSKYFLLCSWS